MNMPRVASVVPADSDLLCETCGYTLNGLPQTGNCPECGKPIEQSVGHHRHLSEFEISPSTSAFLKTTIAVIFNARQFYATLTTRADTRAARAFATVHCGLGTGLFVIALFGHVAWLTHNLGFSPPSIGFVLWSVCLLFAFQLIFVLLALVSWLAAWLSAFEARFWGMRLPYPVVRRALKFHIAHYVPVGLLAVMIIWGYRALLARGIIDHSADALYLYTLCGAVIVCALYLFRAYWIAMKNMMYANR